MTDKARSFEHVRRNVVRIKDDLRFDSRKIPLAENEYVAWLDLMGAGKVMSVSVAKTANFLARLHMAVDIAVMHSPVPVRINPINDGVFITTPSKAAVMSVVREVLYLLGGYFISKAAPQDRFLIRSSIAYGPVYHGSALTAGLSKTKQARHAATLDRVQFGAPIIQAYRAEGSAPPFGCAIHESARAFAPAGEQPFRETLWLWWRRHDELSEPKGMVSLPDLAKCLSQDLSSHFEWMKRTKVFNELPVAKISEWDENVRQYFAVS